MAQAAKRIGYLKLRQGTGTYLIPVYAFAQSLRLCFADGRHDTRMGRTPVVLKETLGRTVDYFSVCNVVCRILLLLGNFMHEGA